MLLSLTRCAALKMQHSQRSWRDGGFAGGLALASGRTFLASGRTFFASGRTFFESGRTFANLRVATVQEGAGDARHACQSTAGHCTRRRACTYPECTCDRGVNRTHQGRTHQMHGCRTHSEEPHNGVKRSCTRGWVGTVQVACDMAGRWCRQVKAGRAI
eukprot:6213416-Pleurochrysis_carterae.AAC.1